MKMGLAVLIGHSIYNIGELLEKDLLKALIGSPHEWLYDVLQTLDGGRIHDFENTIKAHEEVISKMPDICNNITLLRMKVKILAFIETVFQKSKGDRNITFAEIAEKTQISTDEVELLVMKAMSLKLIKGTIDEVEQVVRVTWVIPRILDTKRLEVMSGKLD